MTEQQWVRHLTNFHNIFNVVEADIWNRGQRTCPLTKLPQPTLVHVVHNDEVYSLLVFRDIEISREDLGELREELTFPAASVE